MFAILEQQKREVLVDGTMLFCISALLFLSKILDPLKDA